MAQRASPVVHLELHSRDRERAAGFFRVLCGWEPEDIAVGDSHYLAIDTGRRGVGGGIVESRGSPPLWLPYVAVADVVRATGRACALGASVLLDPRAGPAGSRSVVEMPAGGRLAFWQYRE